MLDFVGGMEEQVGLEFRSGLGFKSELFQSFLRFVMIEEIKQIFS